MSQATEIEKTERLIRSARELRERLWQDPQRPRYHFMPPAGWMNDINGPLFWKGIARDQGTTLFPRGPVAEPGTLCSLLSAHPNLHADLSGRGGYNALSRDPAFARRFLTRFNRRILFGTDNFSLGLPGFLEGLGLDQADLGRIMGENADALLNGTGGD